MALTLEPIKIFTVTVYNIYTVAPLWSQSPSEAVPLDVLWEGPEALLAGGQLVALSNRPFMTSPCDLDPLE